MDVRVRVCVRMRVDSVHAFERRSGAFALAYFTQAQAVARRSSYCSVSALKWSDSCVLLLTRIILTWCTSVHISCDPRGPVGVGSRGSVMCAKIFFCGSRTGAYKDRARVAAAHPRGGARRHRTRHRHAVVCGVGGHARAASATLRRPPNAQCGYTTRVIRTPQDTGTTLKLTRAPEHVEAHRQFTLAPFSPLSPSQPCPPHALSSPLSALTTRPSADIQSAHHATRVTIPLESAPQPRGASHRRLVAHTTRAARRLNSRSKRELRSSTRPRARRRRRRCATVGHAQRRLRSRSHMPLMLCRRGEQTTCLRNCHSPASSRLPHPSPGRARCTLLKAHSEIRHRAHTRHPETSPTRLSHPIHPRQ